MPAIGLANVGLLTTLLETVATSIGAAVVVGGFVAAGMGMLKGRSRREMEANALRHGFVAGGFGMFCLFFDLLMRYAR